MNFWKDKKVLVTGGDGFVGTNLLMELQDKKCKEIMAPTIEEYDLRDERDVSKLFNNVKPNVVIHLAGKVGGIGANKAEPADFFYDNLMMGTLVLEYARKNDVVKTVALAAGCGYPKYLDVPYKEEEFWNGLPDENSIGYSMAKKMLIIQSWTYREQWGMNSVILLPANLYGPHDNFNLTTSHVVPALIRKFVEATINGKDQVIVWGSGNASREFLYVKDTVSVILDAVEKINESGPFNLGTGIETSVKELVNMIQKATGFKGKIIWDNSKPDGQPRRYYDMTKLKNELGYVPNTSLEKGIIETVEWYIKNREDMIDDN